MINLLFIPVVALGLVSMFFHRLIILNMIIVLWILFDHQKKPNPKSIRFAITLVVFAILAQYTEEIVRFLGPLI